MSALLSQQSPARGPLTAAEIGLARELAKNERRSIPEVLEDQTGLSAHALIELLGTSLSYRTMTMADMDGLEPAFDVLPFTEAANLSCLALKDGPRLILGFSDPFDDRMFARCRERIGRIDSWRLVHSSDITAYLNRHEGSMRAIDTMVATAQTVVDRDQDVEALSIRSISEDSSPVVRLVNSTLYDALKAGASDIHLERSSLRACHQVPH